MARRSGSRSSAPERLGEALREHARGLDEVDEAPSRFGGTGLAFRRGRREFAHFHGEAEVDLRLPRAVQRTLRGDPRAVFRASASAWLAYRLETPADLAVITRLLDAAWEAAS